MFVDKAMRLPYSGAPDGAPGAPVLLKNIRLGWKALPGPINRLLQS